MPIFAISYWHLLIVLLLGQFGHAQAAGSGELELNAIDSATGEPTAVRMELRNSKMRPVKPKGFLHIGDCFVFDGQAVLNLPVGQYSFRMERGPEYRIVSGNFRIDQGAADNKTVEMIRFADMAAEGWYSGDLSVAQNKKDIPLMMLAEDLRVAFVTTTDVTKVDSVEKVGHARYYSAVHEFDDRLLGSVAFAKTSDQQIELPEGGYPWAFLTKSTELEQSQLNLNLLHAFHWDLPVWLASQHVDSISLLSDDGTILSKLNRNRSGSEHRSVASGRQPDPVLYSPPEGIGRWSMDIYFRLLESGFRMPPTAASRSGNSSLPVGYHRVYVHCGKEFSYQNWWTNLRQGKCVITSGPLIRPYVDGQPPGHIFRGYTGEPLELEIELTLSTRDKISYLEIIKNGQSFHEVRLAEFKKKNGELPKLTFTDSGWFLVRAICDDATSYKYACSAPFYVDFEGKQRISKSATKFFFDWSEERLTQVQASRVPEEKLALGFHKGAVKFWKTRLDKANVD